MASGRFKGYSNIWAIRISPVYLVKQKLLGRSGRVESIRSKAIIEKKCFGLGVHVGISDKSYGYRVLKNAEKFVEEANRKECEQQNLEE